MSGHPTKPMRAPNADRLASGKKPTIFIAHPSDLLTDHLPNGDGLVAFGFISELGRRGFRLHIATRRAELHSSLPPNVTLHPIPRRFGNDLIDRLYYMRAIRRLLQKLRQTERIDIVHQMNPVFAGLSLGLLGCGLPVVLGTYVARWPGGEGRDAARGPLVVKSAAAGRWIINFAQQAHASALLITTPAAMNRISAPRLARRKCQIIRHAVDEVLFAPPPAWQEVARTAQPTILFYSHLDRRKGVFVLVDAFQEVARAIPSCRLVIVGRGDDADELKAHAAASEYAGRISIAGKVDHSEAPGLIGKHNVYCLPSFGEPYATTALEAMSCARPLVITNVGGLPQIPPPEGALRVPAGDAQALAEALISVLRSPDLQVAMGSANRSFVERHYTWHQVVNDLEGVYAMLLGVQSRSIEL